jgi:hypothetical protein
MPRYRHRPNHHDRLSRRDIVSEIRYTVVSRGKCTGSLLSVDDRHRPLLHLIDSVAGLLSWVPRQRTWSLNYVTRRRFVSLWRHGVPEIQYALVPLP